MKVKILESIGFKYPIIYADPAWKFNNKRTGGSMSSGADHQYKTVMNAEQIAQLPIKEIAADDSILFLWWVASQPKEAILVAESWGFEIKTMNGFVWRKLTKTGKPWFGMGFYTRAGSESCLIATRGNPKILSHSIRAVVEAKVPVDENNRYIHSKKPNIFRERIVQLVGENPRIELFAREEFEGWDAWGNEL